jgi:parvulin-like peptidyl-prolyl isomerase
MARHAVLGPLSLVAIPLVSFLGCGRSHDDAGRSAAATEPPSSVAEAAPASVPPRSGPAKLVPRPVERAAPGTAIPQGIHSQKTVATVNGKPIVAEQVYSLYRMNKEMLRQRGRTLNETEDQSLRAESLEVVIADELLYQAALAKGVTVPAAEIEAGMKQLKVRAGSEESYKRLLAESNLSESEAHREMERNLQTEAYRKSLVAGKGVTEDQAKKFYDANVRKGMFNVPEQVHVQYILVTANEKDPESVRLDARKRAEEAARRAAAGEDFTALAKQYSQDATAARGGDIGFIPRGVMFPKFEEIAFAGKPGDVTPLFETPKGFNVMKILEKKPESTRSYDEVKDALMLDMGRLMEQDIVRAKIQELAARAQIAVLDSSFNPPAPPATAATNTPPPAKR